jgi:uncharacterized membrane protein YcaP (DUF421 family)
MEFVVRAIFIYFFLMLLFTIAGKRSLAELDTFDFILLLIISEATQQALIGQDYSLMTASIVIATLVGLEILMSWVREYWPNFDKFTTGGPLILVDNGKVLHQRLKKERVGIEDILTSARQTHGLERLEQIKYAILEMGGKISIIPREKGAQV